MLPGKRYFYRCCKARRSASHVNKEFWQQFQNYAPPSLRVIRTKFARTIIYIYIIYPRFSIEQTWECLARFARSPINRKNWRFFTGARNWLPLRIKGQKSDGRLQIWCSIQLSLHKEPPEVGLVKKLTRICISGWYGTCQPYIESITDRLTIFSHFQSFNKDWILTEQCHSSSFTETW